MPPTKSELRRELVLSRKRLSEPLWQAYSEQICRHIEGLACVQTASCVALFWPLLGRKEPDLRSLDARLRQLGKAIAYPALREPWGLYLTRNAAELQPGQRGFWEPAAVAERATSGSVEVIITPSVALSPNGARLGYGMGYYDRVLELYRPPAVVVGVSYHSELLATLPTQLHDQNVDWVVTEAGASRATAAAPL